MVPWWVFDLPSKVYYAPCALFGGFPQFSGLGSLSFGILVWFGLPG